MSEHEHVEAVEQLLELMREHDLDALSLEAGSIAYELVRREPHAAAPPGGAAPAPPPAPGAPALAQEKPAAAPARAKKVIAPLVGVFYNAPAPGAEPFVAVGDRVEAGQVVCILEAMKLMNEITTDDAGIVTRVLPGNGELVSIGEELFWIEP